MVHRTKMQTINVDDPPEKVVEEVLKGQHTRMPLWKDEPENIVGLLHTKDLLLALARIDWDVPRLEVAGLAAQPWFVPDTTTVTDQLSEFLKRKAQLAMVVDEYGEVQGLITLEDILEEIVGQITDEHDVQETAIRVQEDGSVNVDGSIAVRDLNRHMDWDLPDEGGHHHRRSRHSHGAEHSRARPGVRLLRLSLRDFAQEPQQDHRTAHQAARRGHQACAAGTRQRCGESGWVTAQPTASPGPYALMASACTEPASSAAKISLIMRWRSTRDLPRKAGETTSTLKWLSPVPGELR